VTFASQEEERAGSTEPARFIFRLADARRQRHRMASKRFSFSRERCAATE
jgi:hypothetical protein